MIQWKKGKGGNYSDRGQYGTDGEFVPGLIIQWEGKCRLRFCYKGVSGKMGDGITHVFVL